MSVTFQGTLEDVKLSDTDDMLLLEVFDVRQPRTLTKKLLFIDVFKSG